MPIIPQPGHIDQIKQINAGVVYRLIDLHGPISRIELSRLTQLAPASITKIVREMLDVQLIKETEYHEAGLRGRPAIGLVLDTAGWHFLAVRLHRGTLTLTLRDISCQALVEEFLPLVPDNAQQPILEWLVGQIDGFFVRHQSRLERLTSVAITLPGQVNVATGVVQHLPGFDVQDLPLGETLEQRIGVPVFIQHEISAWTMAESLFGASLGVDNVIQLVIDETIGAGVISEGQLLHRSGRTLVESGHIQTDPQGERCYCGHHGCLETVASSGSLLTRVASQLATHPDSLLQQQPLTLESLCIAAQRGDSLACSAIASVGQHVGRVLAMMVNVFHPQRILLGSPLNQAAGVLFPAIDQSLRQQALPAYGQSVQLMPTQLKEPGTLGAAALIKTALYRGDLLLTLLQG